MIARFVRDFRVYYDAHSTDYTKPYDGIPEVLRELRDRSVRMAVLTNKPHGFACELVERFFPGVFSGVFGQRDGKPHKPDPGALAEVLAFLGEEKKSGLYIGDTATDMLTGKQGGLYTVGVLWGFRTKKELVDSGADAIITKPLELLALAVDNDQKSGYTCR